MGFYFRNEGGEGHPVPLVVTVQVLGASQGNGTVQAVLLLLVPVLSFSQFPYPTLGMNELGLLPSGNPSASFLLGDFWMLGSFLGFLGLWIQPKVV